MGLQKIFFSQVRQLFIQMVQNQNSYSLFEPQNNIKKIKIMKLADAVEPPQEKPLDPHIALQKVLKLDRKHTNFDFSDHTRNVQFRVQNPQLLNDAPPNQHLLRQFWRHVHNYYFRLPQQNQIDRLAYFSSILNEQLSHELPFRPSQQFWKHLELIFNPEFLRNRTLSLDKNLDSRNWLFTLYLYNRLLENQEGKSNKKLEKEYQDLLIAQNKIQLKHNNRRFNQSLRLENQQLNKLLPEINQENDQVTQQIKKYQQQLEAYHQNTVRLFHQLQSRVSKEQRLKRSIYCFGNEEYQIEQNFIEGNYNILNTKLDQVGLQLKYLQYTINNLEQKQIAQSISKITKYEKSRVQAKFIVDFQESINIKKKSLTQTELLRLNKIRQYSIFKYYNTCLKTPYSFICQNYFGFQDIFLHRNAPCKYNNKDILQEIKKTAIQSVEATKNFQKFDICHHCKLLYPENYLTKCKYTSQKLGIPIQPAPYSDSYLIQISKIQTAKSQRYSMRRRNYYQNYTKLREQYSCNRKFCKYCIKTHYDGLDKNGLCPFCRGICFCTRCSRNDLITRLKSMYLLLGGQASKFNPDKFFQIQNFKDLDDEEKQIRKKGRPKKLLKSMNPTPNKAYEHINSIRVQLEPLRLLCDMVKKRQKKKQKLIESQQQFFMEKVGMICRDFTLMAKLGRHDSTGQQDSQSQENKNKVILEPKNRRKKITNLI